MQLSKTFRNMFIITFLTLASPLGAETVTETELTEESADKTEQTSKAKPGANNLPKEKDYSKLPLYYENLTIAEYLQFIDIKTITGDCKLEAVVQGSHYSDNKIEVRINRYVLANGMKLVPDLHFNKGILDKRPVELQAKIDKENPTYIIVSIKDQPKLSIGKHKFNFTYVKNAKYYKDLKHIKYLETNYSCDDEINKIPVKELTATLRIVDTANSVTAKCGFAPKNEAIHVLTDKNRFSEVK